MFTIEFNDKKPLYQQLYEHIYKLIIDGELRAEDRLPSKRALAQHAHISIKTIETAYEQLLAEGYIYSKPQSGYYVSPIDFSRIHTQNEPLNIAIPNEPTILEYEFRTNSVDTEGFPFSVWSKLMREVLRDEGNHLLKKGSPLGLYSLRCEISAYLKAYRNIEAAPEQIVVGAGSEYLINIIIQLIAGQKTNERQIYAVENPGYHKIANILAANKIDTEYIEMDNSGIDINCLYKSNASVVHITPSHHFPLGIVTPVARRYELLKWAKERNAYIIEDDYDSEFRYSGRPIPALQSLDTQGRVIYLNTFAKNLAPSLRISYMVLPKELAESYIEHFSFYSNTVSAFEQYTLSLFMQRGYFERYVNKMRVVYKNRMNTLINAIKDSSLCHITTISGENIGLHLLLAVNNGMSENELVKTAYDNGILVTDISRFYKGENKHKPTIILGYAGIDEKKIPSAVNKLAEVWNR